MVHLVSFATENFYTSQKKLIESSLVNGVDFVHTYNPTNIDEKFVSDNAAIINGFNNRGAGYWLFKPYIILDTMKNVNDGDYVVYVDSGINFIDNIHKILNAVDDDIILFNCHGHINKTFTKRDCFVYLDCDTDVYVNGQHTNAAIQIYKNTPKSKRFVELYMYWCKNQNVITDNPNVCGLDNYPEFVDHRHDQSVLSLLSIKHDIHLHRDPTQYGNLFKQYDKYPQIFNHHRSRN